MTRVFLFAFCILTFTFSQAQLPSYLPTNGLVGWWPFNGNANDESGNGNNGTVNGATLTTDRFGNVGKAYGFENNLITIPHNTNLGISINNSFTVSLWFRKSVVNSLMHLIGKRSTAGSASSVINWQMVCNSSDNIAFGGAPGSGITCLVPIPQDTWVNYIGIFKNRMWLIYYNGVLMDSTFSNFFDPDPETPLTIGNSANYEPFNGSLDDIAIYNRALTQAEITALYTAVPPCEATSSTTNLTIPYTSLPYTWNGLTFNAAGTQTAHLTNACGGDSAATLNLTVTNTLPSYLPTNGLVGWWPFNGNANDESGNGNNGTVNGATLTTDRFGNAGSAYVFGANSFITTDSSNGFPFGILDFTITFWINISQIPFNGTTLFYNQEMSQFQIWFVENKIYFYSGGNGILIGNYSDSQFNKWVNYQIIRKENILKLFVNGNLLTETLFTLANNAISNNRKLSFGSRTYGYPHHFYGSLDDIALYNRALSASEIRALYTNCASNDSSSLTASGCNSYILPWGDTIATSGTYTHTYVNATGCDSVVTANITIRHAEVGASMNLSGVGPYSLPWGQTVTSSGYYSHVYQNQYGCDSLVTAYVAVEFPADSTRKNIGVNVENPQRNLHIKDVMRLEPRDTAPENPTMGDIYFDRNSRKLKYFNGLQWVEM